MKHYANNLLTELPKRSGPAPDVFNGIPQHQLDQIPSEAEWQALNDIIKQWPGVEKRDSQRAPEGTTGLFLSDADAQKAQDDAFLLDTEFAHHHPLPDGSLHLVLPPSVHQLAIDQNWSVPHPLAGQPTVSKWTVLVFAPRNAEELREVVKLIESAEGFARGLLS